MGKGRANQAASGDAVVLVEEVLREAARRGASDVHFEPTSSAMVIRFRLDGALADVRRIPKELGANVISRLKVLAGLLTYRNDIPQEGRIQAKRGQEPFSSSDDTLNGNTHSELKKVPDPVLPQEPFSSSDDTLNGNTHNELKKGPDPALPQEPFSSSNDTLNGNTHGELKKGPDPAFPDPVFSPFPFEQRLAIFPTVHGQRAAVRLFYDDGRLGRLDQLGFSPHILASLRKVAASPQGVLLLTGPAGSGKSTTLAAMLRHILAAAPGRSVVSLEDPVERHLDGVTQVEVSASGAMTYPVALRSLLRQDPEVLMIGEIRDAQTAAIVVEAGLTGHLLLSTMHSGSPAGAILRLLEMGLEPYQVTSSLWAIVNQRLLRKLCPSCRGGGAALEGGVALRVRQQDPAVAGASHGLVRTQGHGTLPCPECLGTGYRGRILVAEMLELDGELRKAVLARADLEELERILAARGHMDLRRDAERLVAQGLTSREEMTRACGPQEE